jgi:hypothetical protein
MVPAVVDISVYADVCVHVPHHDLLSNVTIIGSPIGKTVVIILGIKRRVIRDVVRVGVTDAYAGVVSASNENCRTK